MPLQITVLSTQNRHQSLIQHPDMQSAPFYPLGQRIARAAYRAVSGTWLEIRCTYLFSIWYLVFGI